MNYSVDVLIVGGGHAGIEAAWIASQFPNIKVALVSMPEVLIGSTPCNPAIGGVGKGQVVRELDALGGLMPILADLAGIQYRTLNESKGIAVRSTRVQVDKHKYAFYAEKLITENPNIQLIRDRVINIEYSSHAHYHVVCQHCSIDSAALIVTTGTFLNGKLHCGQNQDQGGRVNSPSSQGLETLVTNIKSKKVRFKTGTPPRIFGDSINFDGLIKQPSDSKTRNFHLENACFERHQEQVDCYLTRIDQSALETIRQNREKSPIFNGQIKATGPRYCPSIEDKAFRYPDRHSHHVFLEPEDAKMVTFYPNGLSTSLPPSVQDEFISQVAGLENAKIAIYGYAVEYDVVDTLDLLPTLEHKEFSNLFFAGQINGTSGYEEAAAQGIVAGINAASRVLGLEEVHFSRDESYIGVLINDLVSTARDEPYRLFTARSEKRLFLREDNAFLRLSKIRLGLNLNNGFDHKLLQLIEEYQVLSQFISNYTYSPLVISVDGQEISLPSGLKMLELLKRPDLDPISCLTTELRRLGFDFSYDVIATCAIEAKYAGYIVRSDEAFGRINSILSKKINWQDLAVHQNISYECRQRIKQSRPATFFQLKAIDGIRPATLSFVASIT